MNEHKPSNGTLFGALPLRTALPVVGGLLVAVFVIVEPEASLGMNALERTVFWTAQIGLSLLGLYVASLLVVPRAMRRMPAWLALVLAGIGGALLMAPGGYALDYLMPAIEDSDDEWLDVFGQQGLVQGILAEFLEAAPIVVLMWLLINLPFLFSGGLPGGAPDHRERDSAEDTLDKEEAGRLAEAARDEFLAMLPDALGKEVLAISSDMHYLHVYTDRGHSMVLGSLARAADALGDAGIRVHRGHWVARRAIVSIIKDRQQWYCLLSNDLRIPISRRNKTRVASWFGHSTKIQRIDARTRAEPRS